MAEFCGCVYSHFNSRTSCEVRLDTSKIFVQNFNFNSRTSCEVRRPRERPISRLAGFQLTHLLRGATGLPEGVHPGSGFQLTHLLRGATGRGYRCGCFRRFQLTHLLRGATAIYCSTFILQTHHLVRGGQVNQIIGLSGVKSCPFLTRTGNDFCIIHGSLKPLQNNWAFWIVGRFRADMLHRFFPIISQVVETQAVLFWIHQTYQFVFQL